MDSSFLVAVFGALLLLAATTAYVDAKPYSETFSCPQPVSPCFNKKIQCPSECPYTKPAAPGGKACHVDCKSYLCEATCKIRKPNCNGNGASCYDPRFIGGDGVVFYFHGGRDEHFALISDPALQINARFIGHRPAGRSRDFTWTQALGLLVPGGHHLTIEATPAIPVWNDALDHLLFSFDGTTLDIPDGYRSEWISPDGKVAIERTAAKNAINVVVDGVLELSVGVVPVTPEDDKVHNYQIPVGDSYAHLELQFKFLKASDVVEGVIGRTYRPGYVNVAAMPGVEMPVVGGEDEYRTTSLLAPDCNRCTFRIDGAAEVGTTNIRMPFGEIY